jgi:DNA polymerase
MKIALVGEAYGQEEALMNQPFVGPSGKLLDAMLSDAGIKRHDCLVTNVFNFQPQRNDLSTLCGKKAESKLFHSWGPITKGGYLLDRYAPEIDRLRRELTTAKPHVVVGLGNTACWALLQETAISKLRGYVDSSTLCPGLKVIPTYHPAAILREYSLRHVTVLDLQKAAREAEYPEIRYPLQTVHMAPTIADLSDYYWPALWRASRLAVDIETANGQMTCIGFAPSDIEAFVIPFWRTAAGGNYWSSLEEELFVLDFVRRVLALPAEKIFQNGLYDMQWLWQRYSIPVANASHDTMLLHHALHPESEKSLGFLGSVYTNRPRWKDMRSRGPKTEKRDD